MPEDQDEESNARTKVPVSGAKYYVNTHKTPEYARIVLDQRVHFLYARSHFRVS